MTKAIESWKVNGQASNTDGRLKKVYQSLVGKYEENRNLLELDVERKDNLKKTGMRIWTRCKGLLKMILGMLTTCHTQYTCDTSINLHRWIKKFSECCG
jgi:hypothetical protein